MASGPYADANPCSCPADGWQKEPPYLPAVHVLSEDFVALGRASNRRAIDTYAACAESGIWPGHTDTDEPLDPPRWLTHREDAS